MTSSMRQLLSSISTLKFNRIEAYHQTSQLTPVQPTGILRHFRVTWKDITYAASLSPFGGKTKIILNGVSGCFESGQVTAIMGPSGCGKSSLLGCISGQKKNGLNGSITISDDIKVKFAFIVQDNHILQWLTVRESLLFASKLKNGSNADHFMIVSDVINKLMIETCADNYPNRCSGGQLKRVLIGLELVSKPNILILDEPTSGLDSVTTWQLINNLIELTQSVEPVAVVVTIHQPSARLFNLFHRIILMSCEGQCIFNGPPQSMSKLFSEIGLFCPKFSSISDFGLEVASKDYGAPKLLTLSTIMKIEAMSWPENGQPITIHHKYKTIQHIWFLTLRSILCIVRDPFNIPLRIFGYMGCAVLISMMYGPNVGYLNGCSQDFSIGDGTNLIEKWKETGQKIFDNVALLAFTAHFAWFAGIFPVLLVFPIELNVFLQEYGNGYYSGFSYFVSKVLTDFVFNLFMPLLGSIIIFFMTSQYWESVWRLISFNFIFILLTLNSSSLGFTIGTLLADFPTAIAFVGMLSLVPLILLSGVMIPIEQMPAIFRWMSFTDFMRFGYMSEVISTYGFDRCLKTNNAINKTELSSLIPADKLMDIFNSDKIDPELLLNTLDQIMGSFDSDESRSIVLKTLNVSEYDYFFSIAMLITHIIVYRVLTYIFILRKTSR